MLADGEDVWAIDVRWYTVREERGGPAHTRRFLFSPLPRPLLRYRVRRDHSWGAPRPCDRSLAQEYRQTPTEARGNRWIYDKARGEERARTSGAVSPPLGTIFACSKFDM